jgi:hypothetical protein
MPLQAAVFARLALLCALVVPVVAQAGTPILQPVRSDEGPRLDGFLDDSVWREAEIATDFIQQRPEFGAPSTAHTRVRVVYTKSALYIGFECDEPVEVLARSLGRDALSDRYL